MSHRSYPNVCGPGQRLLAFIRSTISRASHSDGRIGYIGHHPVPIAVNRADVIEPLKQTQDMLARLLALLEAGEADKFAAHLYHSRRQYRRTCERPNKGNKAIDREVISSYQIAQSLGFKGDYRAWEYLLRIHQ